MGDHRTGDFENPERDQEQARRYESVRKNTADAKARADARFAEHQLRNRRKALLDYTDEELREELRRRFNEKYPEDPTPPQIRRPGEARSFG